MMTVLATTTEIETRIVAIREAVDTQANELSDLLEVCQAKGNTETARMVEALLEEINEWRRTRPAIQNPN